MSHTGSRRPALFLSPATTSRLLLVAPDQGLRDASRFILELAGLRVRAVEDIHGARRALWSGRIGAVLIDLAAFDEAAFQLCGALGHEPSANGVSVFLRTVCGARSVARALDLGVHAVFHRPFEDEALGCMLAVIFGETATEPAWASWSRG